MIKLFLFDNNENLIGAVDPLEGKETNELNKLHTLEVVVNYNELVDKAVYIGHKDYKRKDVFHLYKIDRVDKESTTNVKIVAVHKFYDDMESDGYIKDYRPQNKELVGVLTTLLKGSSWQLGTVNVQRLFSGNFYYLSRKEALSKLVEETQIEISPRLEFTKGKITAKYLDVFTRMGRDNGKVFIHGKDLLTVHEKNSKGAIYTAVIGRGKGEEVRDDDGQATGGYGRRITFKDVVWEKIAGKPVDKPAGEEMLEIPALTKIYGFEKGTKPRVKIVEFQDEEDPERLIMLSYEWLKKNSRVQVEYKATVRNVGNLDLGDTVGVYNPKLGIKYKTRVFKVVRNLTDNNLTEFGIGDKVTSSPFSRTIELAKDVKNFQDDTIYWLDKIRERLSDKFLNEDGYNYDLKTNNKYELPAGFYSFDKPIEDNPTKVVYMGAGKIAIADSKKPTGEWNWKTFLDGKGATLDLINTGILKAGRIQAADGRSYWDLDTGDFHLEQGIVEKTFKNIVEGKAQEIVDEVKKSIPNMEGLKGKDAYVHKKYSNNADGSDMGDNSNSKYMGIYTGDKKTPPTDPNEYSWTKIKEEGKLYKGYANSLTGLDFTIVEPEDEVPLFAKNRPRVNITNDDDISDIWQANMFLSLKPNTKYTLTARAKGNNNKLWAYFRNNKTSQEYSWGQLEFGNTLQTKNIVFTTGSDVDDVLFKFILVPEDENWTGVQVDWYTIHESERVYTDYPTNEPAQYHKYRYFGYVFKNGTPTAGDFDWFDIQQKSITGDKYTHLVYSDNADGSNFGREPKVYMGIARTTSPVTPTDKKAFKWVRLKGDDGKSAPNFNLLLNTEIKSSSSYTLNGATPTINQNDFNGRNSVEINNRGLTGNAWKGISFRSSKKKFKRGETIVIRLPIYIYSDVNVDNGITLALKSHVGNKTLTGFNLDNGTARDTWVIKEIQYTVQQDFTSPADNLFYIFSTKNGHFKIAEPYMSVGGDMPTDWIPSLEDLKAHSLTANVRVAGTYEGKKTNDVKFFVDVYYDGVKVTNGFNLTARVWGGGLNKTQENATYNNDGELTNVYYSNGEKDGTTINIKLDVEYQFLKTTCFARLDNLPDTELVKEITNKYKTFDTTLEQFKSQIGELNDKQFKVAIRGENLLNSAEKKTGNNLTYTTLEPMKPNTTYTLVADFRYFPANQELRIFNSERQRLVAGINIFTFTVSTETRTINLTPLGNETEVKNLEVWEGNFNEGLEKNSFDAVTGGAGRIVGIKLKNEFKEGRYYKVMFDTTAPNNSVMAIGIDEYFLTGNTYKTIPDNNYKSMTAKDNVLFTRISSKANDNKEAVYLEFSRDFDKSQITNVRFFEINLGFRYTKRDETVDIASLINQSKEEITLKLSKTLATDYMTKSQTETSIKLLRDKIENVVTDENFGTTLVQNAKSLKLAWNNYSKYFQFEDESLILYEGKAESAKKRVKLDYLGTSYYDQNGEFSGAIRGYYKSYFWGRDVGYYSGMNFVIKANGRVGWFEETEEWGLKTERALLAYNLKEDDNDLELKNTLISYVDFEVRGNSTFKGKTNIRHLLVAGSDRDPEGYYEGRHTDVNINGLHLKFRNGILVS